METLANRLDACQETLLELYEKDSNKLEDQIKHWAQVRLENVMLFKARECGMTRVGCTTVPALTVSKAKACRAIEVQLALQTLMQSAYSTEAWTLRDTCLEMWDAPPKKCWKKKGLSVLVKFDGSSDRDMIYTGWHYIYVQDANDDTWHKVPGKVDELGLYYEHDGVRVNYVDFGTESLTYGVTGTWEVHVAGRVIHHTSASVSSTQATASDDEPLSPIRLAVSPVPAPASAASARTGTTPPTNLLCTAPAPPSPPAKRQRVIVGQQHLRPDSTRTVGEGQVECYDKRSISNTNSTAPRWNHGDTDTVPVIHLRGDANCLKCFRYRVQKHKDKLYDRVSSTWHWAGGKCDKTAFVTVWYTSVEQRKEFLTRVNIPKGVIALPGYMSAFV
ncbi:E2 protein [Human papillomavirus type 27b]|uniref:Regulatory protein E2 n=1 Tax=Human papillomavirus type 27b TaxID=325568 RepID=Q4H2F0_HPV27|nr:E2 protein [Human papillomavirus type 27b]